MRWGRSGWRGGEGKLSRSETRFKFKALEFQGLGPKLLRMTDGQLKPLVDYEESARPGMYVHSETWPYNTPGNDTKVALQNGGYHHLDSQHDFLTKHDVDNHNGIRRRRRYRRCGCATDTIRCLSHERRGERGRHLHSNFYL